MDDIHLKLIANPHKVRSFFVSTSKKEELKLSIEYYFNENISYELFDSMVNDMYEKVTKEQVSQVISDIVDEVVNDTTDKLEISYISNIDIS